MTAARSHGRPIGVGVIGLGFMGRTHVDAYRAADAAGFANRLVAVCDPNAERRAGHLEASGNIGSASGRAQAFDPAVVRAYERAHELLADPAVELVSICTPTDAHVDLAIAALEAKKHVLVEKPVALRAQDVSRLAAVVDRARTLCMPAMCMRFWPGWDWLRARIAAGTFGAVKSAEFVRLSARPSWSREFYGDVERSGGALFDLHVHDADFVRWCFGAPFEVSTQGTVERATTLYRFAHTPARVSAEGGWIAEPDFPFCMRYAVAFDEAIAEFDVAREPRLRVLRGKSIEPVAIDSTSGYDGEVRLLLEAIAGGKGEVAATVAESVELMRMLAAERESARLAAPVTL